MHKTRFHRYTLLLYPSADDRGTPEKSKVEETEQDKEMVNSNTEKNAEPTQ